MDPGARPGPRKNPGRSRNSATSHDRAAATTQHLKSRANGDSANPRVREPIFPILRETTAKECLTDHQEDTRRAENGTTTAETRRPINDAPRGPESTVEQFMRLSEQLWQKSESPSIADTGTMSTAQEVAETVKNVHVQSVPVNPRNSVQAVTPGKPAPRVGPSPISIHQEGSWHRWNQKTSTPRRSQPRKG